MMKETPQAGQSICGRDPAGDKELFHPLLEVMKVGMELQASRHNQLVIEMQIIETKLDLILSRLGINVSDINIKSHGNQEPGE